MSQPTSPTAPGAASSRDGKPLSPPEDAFWQIYSPHYEFPLSSIASVALHVLAAVTLFVILTYFIENDHTPAPPIEAVKVSGIGDQETLIPGTGPGPGDPGVGGVMGAETGDLDVPPELQNPNLSPVELQKPIENIREWVPELSPSDIAKYQTTEASERFRGLQEDMQQKMAKGVAQGYNPQDQGTGSATSGSGSGGGGSGDGNPPPPAVRTKRLLRWTIEFNTNDGRDYLRQLAVMKATLVFETPQGQLWVVDNLGGNPSQHEEDRGYLETNGRMRFIDDNPRAVAEIAQSLRLSFRPPRLFAFFPLEIEKELTRKELSHRNRREEDIIETRFKVLVRGGRPEIRVVYQRAR